MEAAGKVEARISVPLCCGREKASPLRASTTALSQDAKFPAQIKDCKAAIRWLRNQAKKYKIDPDQVVAWGGSAGGHLASLVGTARDVTEWEQGHRLGSSQVQAVIDWYGRADLTPVSIDPALADSPSASLLGGSGREVGELAREAESPHARFERRSSVPHHAR